jgi:hypothetical protein
MIRRIAGLFIATAILLIGGPAYSAADPYTSTGVLSFIGEESVEIRYFGDPKKPRPAGRNDTLDALDFVQTLGTVTLVSSIPASPINPILVHAAIDALGIPHEHYKSCWPEDGALVMLPTAPVTAIDAALDAAGAYYDPNRHAREFSEAYWKQLFTYKDPGGTHVSGMPGELTAEVLKEAIVDVLPFPAKLGPMETYQARGIVPFMYLKGKWVVQCFLFACWTVPRCVVRWNPVSEGYGMTGIK